MQNCDPPNRTRAEILGPTTPCNVSSAHFAVARRRGRGGWAGICDMVRGQMHDDHGSNTSCVAPGSSQNRSPTQKKKKKKKEKREKKTSRHAELVQLPAKHSFLSEFESFATKSHRTLTFYGPLSRRSICVVRTALGSRNAVSLHSRLGQHPGSNEVGMVSAYSVSGARMAQPGVSLAGDLAHCRVGGRSETDADADAALTKGPGGKTGPCFSPSKASRLRDVQPRVEILTFTSQADARSRCRW